MEFVVEPSLLSAAYWVTAVAFVAEFLVFRGHRSAGERRGTTTFVKLLAVVVGSIVVSAALHRGGLGNLPENAAEVWRWAALGLFAAGVALRYWAASALGEWFSREVRASSEQHLVSHGPYRRLRHPLYTGLLLAAVGMSALFANVPGLVVAVVANAWVVDARMREEERELSSVLGDRYVRWCAKRWRLVPGLY